VGVKLGLAHYKRKDRLMVYEKRMLKRIFGPKRDEVKRRLEKTAQ
jgi:hypothetical protein